MEVGVGGGVVGDLEEGLEDVADDFFKILHQAVGLVHVTVVVAVAVVVVVVAVVVAGR